MKLFHKIGRVTALFVGMTVSTLGVTGNVGGGVAVSQVTPLPSPGVATASNVSPAKQAADIRQVRENLKKRYPGSNFKEVRSTELEGVFEITVGRNVAYTDRHARYFLFGHLFDMPKQQDLTESRLQALARIEFADLPKDAAIVIKKGNGQRHLAVFSDPDCPFCRRLEQELVNVNDVTIHLYLMPLPTHRDARDKSIAVWCSSDRQQAWTNLMLKNTNPATNKPCPHPVDRVVAYARQQSISATPTLIRADGSMHSGAMTTAQIEKWLGAAKTP